MQVLGDVCSPAIYITAISVVSLKLQFLAFMRSFLPRATFIDFIKPLKSFTVDRSKTIFLFLLVLFVQVLVDCRSLMSFRVILTFTESREGWLCYYDLSRISLY